MAKKYKVGDRVVVREDLRHDVNYFMEDSHASDVAVDTMLNFRGQVVTIGDGRYDKYSIEECGYSWTDEMFAGLESELFAAIASVDDLL